MKVTPLAIAGAWLIESPVFPDERGMFREWFKVEALKENGIPEFEVRQANTSISHEGVIRGIHFSDELVGQSKIVTCSSGSILDVIVEYDPKVEYGINPLDPDLDIPWPNQNPSISKKDRSAKTIKEYFESRGSID
jgi:dTDP-4-dehydrorhamnose 3,5-epimerase-like enzyme